MTISSITLGDLAKAGRYSMYLVPLAVGLICACNLMRQERYADAVVATTTGVVVTAIACGGRGIANRLAAWAKKNDPLENDSNEGDPRSHHETNGG
ncbi:MAG: hypothetical protein H7144_07265 [Burkholderiales bacterium]|nr:hypothetical protein [Phycisphaerae bacterium]